MAVELTPISTDVEAEGYYADQSDVTAFIGEDTAQILSNLDNENTVTIASRVQLALDWADAQIDGLFRNGPYAVPLAPITELMTSWAVVFAAWKLHAFRGERSKDGTYRNPYDREISRVRCEMKLYKGGVYRLDANRVWSDMPTAPASSC